LVARVRFSSRYDKMVVDIVRMVLAFVIVDSRNVRKMFEEYFSELF
jgi:hypothetical protein